MAISIGTNCYLSLADASAYFLDRLDSEEWDTASDTTKAAALVTATRIIDNEYSFIGQAVSSSQRLAWPRAKVSYFDPRLNMVVETATDEYPQRLKDATCEQAYHLLLNENVLESMGSNFERIKVGPIELEGMNEGYVAPPKISSLATSILKPLLLESNFNRSWWRV
jgi:hypothetical protein